MTFSLLDDNADQPTDLLPDADSAPAVAAPQPAKPPKFLVNNPLDPTKYRKFGDAAAVRRSVFDKSLAAAQAIKPVRNNRYELSLHDVGYQGQENFTLAEQKKALLTGGTVARRMYGTWRLHDLNGNMLSEKRAMLAKIPYYTDRGTFINNGTDYSISNQFRLRPGIYTREKANGEVEAHANVLKGPGHKVFMDPESGVFKLNLHQSEVPLMPVLRALGATNAELRTAWGDDLFNRNSAKDDPNVISKLYKKLVKKPTPGVSQLDAVKQAFEQMELDPEISKRTLGAPHTNVNAAAVLDTTRKLLKVSKKEVEADARDAMAYQTVHGPEDIISERLSRNRAKLNGLLWKAASKGQLGSHFVNALDDDVRAALLTSRLGQNLESINPAEVLDQQSRVSRMGEGGIGSMDAVPAESRNVHASQLGFVDALRTAESGSVGVDLRLAQNVIKGPGNVLYAPVRDADGDMVYKSAAELADGTVAMPGELQSDRQYISAIRDGKLVNAHRSKVDFELPQMDHTFSPMANLVPIKSSVKGQRLVMASRMLQQALPLLGAEAPFVRGGDVDTPNTMDLNGIDDRVSSKGSYEERYSSHLGAVKAKQQGTVLDVTQDGMHVQYADGTKDLIELANNFPYNRKTRLHQTPTLKPGETFQPDQLLATSNYTDKDGAMALGRNLRMAYLPYDGKNWEDAVVLSESGAKKFTSEHMYKHDREWSDSDLRGRASFVGAFPSKYDKATLANMDEKGVVKQGTILKPGDPLILAAEAKERNKKSLVRGQAPLFVDKSVTWDSDYEGEVTDVIDGDKGTMVVVKANKPMQVGDKLCYSSDTSVLTWEGWKPIAEVTLADRIASLKPDGQIEYIPPVAVHTYRHTGRMYEVQNTQVSHCVTDNHQLYAKRRGDTEFKLHTAEQLYSKRYHLKMDGEWQGESPEFVTIEGQTIACGQGGAGQRKLPDLPIPTAAFMALLGAYLSEGSVVNTKRKRAKAGWTRRVAICQKKEVGLKRLHDELIPILTQAGLRPKVTRNYGMRIDDARLSMYFAQFGHAGDKFIPSWVFGCSKADLEILYDWLMWGDGNRTGTGHNYTSTSLRLCQDVQRLCLHIGKAGKVEIATAEGWQTIKGKRVWCNTSYKTYIYNQKLRPQINHSHVKKQGRGWADRWMAYDGMVYCVTLPRNHVLYVSRDGKPCWSGNSGRYGDKGILSAIVPDHEMITDGEGNPFDILVSPLGLTSRINPAQLVEAALGKISEKTGKVYRVKDFDEETDYAQYAHNELKKHGLEATETVIDPRTGRKIPNIATGNRWMMKLHHMAADKLQGRGLGAYSSDGTPAGKTDTSDSSKKMGLLDLHAILSSGATQVLREAHMLRGQANPKYWTDFMSGNTPAEPLVPDTYKAFVSKLQASGINPVRTGTKTQLMAMTDKAVDELTGDRELQNADTVDWKTMDGLPGGLFDSGLTGGHSASSGGGNRWSHIKLHTPLPNPVMEEPIRQVLGLTKPKFEAILAGKETLAFAGVSHGTGPQAVQQALAAINLPKMLEQTREQVKSTKKTQRDSAIRKLGYLKTADELGIHPKDWVLSKVPVLPPAFRPISVMGNKKLPLVDDANLLYKDLFEANKNVSELSKHLSPADYGDETLTTYKAFKAVTGLGDPVQVKNVERGVEGILKHVLGTGGPKTSMVQRKLLGGTVDFVSRGVIIPNPDLDMDQVGIPEDKAWAMYQPMVVRRLVRQGMGRAEAIKASESKTAPAKKALDAELKEAVVIYNRAPVLHRYGFMAGKPVLTKEKVLQFPTFVFKGLGADVDGDTMNVQALVTDKAKQDALEKMLPSKNLHSTGNFKVHQLPEKDYVAGLHAASTAKNDDLPAVTFAKVVDAVRAHASGRIGLDRKVRILEEED